MRAVTDRPRVGDRRVINGMVYKIRTGISWRDLPERYGPWQTVYTRFRRYALDGMFTRALQQIQAHADAAGDIDWLVHRSWPGSATRVRPASTRVGDDQPGSAIRHLGSTSLRRRPAEGLLQRRSSRT
ncbi:transposase [Streptomyces sp. NPDC002838]|uniref:transposase n=1 Tax=Streptomyces sp. NPDC002838 TaxID=3154436 RepID=UPI0033304984